MRTVNFAPLNRSFIGFDQLTSLIDNAKVQDQHAHAIPYNIESIDDTKYRITLAVAGFSESQLSIESENNNLVISGTQVETKGDPIKFIHQGLKQQNFTRKFQLGDHVKVIAANLECGLLVIDLERKVPDALKPLKIKIGTENSLLS